jgi:uncharacterized protein (TIGR00661 family)
MKFNKRRVLIAPLDWGLGHATRCIPVIRAFEKYGWEIIIAADGAGELVLRQEFPQSTFIKLEGYHIRYSASKWTMALKMALQVPKILAAIKKEHRWLQQAIDTHHIDLVISDNRYGLYSDKAPCIFITHQLNIQAPFKWISERIRQLNYKYISRFTECWVPDAEVNSLAGDLSHPSSLHPFPLHYIGPLSRFKKQMAAIRYKYVLLLSGPEPQRTLLEKQVLKDIVHLEGEVLVVRGKPGEKETLSLKPNITVYNHLEGSALEKVLNNAEYIISRPGYTTVMEIAALQKRSILIPTPGQTEQEYLAKYLRRQGLAYSISQDKFSLPKALQQAEVFDYRPFAVTSGMLEMVLEDFLNRYFKPKPGISFAAS